MKIYLNGKFVYKEEAKVSVFDHGLLYGDGVFEGIRAYNGKIFKLKEHIDRLYESARAIKLEILLTKEQMKTAIIETVRENKLYDAYIRVVVTRGEGDLGIDPRKCSNPTVFVIADKIVLYPEEYYKNGLELVIVSTRRNIPDALNPRIKSLNYLNNILAKIESNLRNVPEAIMLNKDGFVAECTGDNIFILKENVLITPPVSVGVLSGITRQTVMDLARRKLKINVKEELFTEFCLYTADECFLTGTAAEIVPVVKVNDRVIGSGSPGNITLQLCKEFKRLTTVEGEKVYS